MRSPRCCKSLHKVTELIPILEIISPSCCNKCSLHKATEIISILDIISSVLLCFVAAVCVYFSFSLQKGDDEISTNNLMILTSGILLGVLAVGQLVFGIILIQGCKHRNERKCKSWLIFTVIFLFGFAAWSIMGLLVEAGDADVTDLVATVFMVMISYKSYSYLFVYGFVIELELGILGNAGQQQQQQDVDEHDGQSTSFDEQGPSSSNSVEQDDQNLQSYQSESTSIQTSSATSSAIEV